MAGCRSRTFRTNIYGNSTQSRVFWCLQLWLKTAFYKTSVKSTGKDTMTYILGFSVLAASFGQSNHITQKLQNILLFWAPSNYHILKFWRNKIKWFHSFKIMIVLSGELNLRNIFEEIGDDAWPPNTELICTWSESLQRVRVVKIRRFAHEGRKRQGP